MITGEEVLEYFRFHIFRKRNKINLLTYEMSICNDKIIKLEEQITILEFRLGNQDYKSIELYQDNLHNLHAEYDRKNAHKSGYAYMGSTISTEIWVKVVKEKK